ncbi:hypothetical protein AWM75_00375 [Aerococcus urinaehominis]|uniref:Uncharacterized protein n=1 Tax=Aerococcus urinaehominis TaxID=128944 RepID=A0A0X8FJK8_9LACT|nr:DUF308 domain-containing protein [Aerococcus urinaehominis]AMB98538.1 hypothetical protein AWM75_00375 [Aerococcus urinaehominis]SDL78935.1 Uncharacterized membrane protein HdeD, DUF308 family [Aerococcus urinaehominis]
MSNDNQSSFSWADLLIGALYIIVALIAFRNPVSSILAIAFVFGFAMILGGIFALVTRNRINERFGTNMIGTLILAIIRIILGVIVVFNIEIGVLTMPVVLALWFIFEAIMGIYLANTIKAVNGGFYWLSIIIYVISLIVGFYLLFNPATALALLPFLVGVYFMFNGIRAIVSAFV